MYVWVDIKYTMKDIHINIFCGSYHTCIPAAISSKNLNRKS